MDASAVIWENGRVETFFKYFSWNHTTDTKKNELSPWLKKQWCIPPEASAEFVAAMEDVLEIYQRPEDATNPVVCVDETSKQHIKETRQPLPIVEGSPRRYDYEYQRNGVSNMFMIFAPLHGFRQVEVTDRRTSIDLLISAETWLIFISPMLKRLLLFATISILTHRLRCIKLFNRSKPGVLPKNFSSTIRRSMAGWDWTFSANPRMSFKAYRWPRDPKAGDPGMANPKKWATCQYKLAVYYRRCAYKTQATLSINYHLTKH